MSSITVPREILRAIKVPKEELETVLKKELAFALYERELLSLGKARKLAGISKWEFIQEVSDRKIERHYTEEEVKEDLAFAEGSE